MNLPGVPGVTGASVDKQSNVAISVGSGSYAFTVSTLARALSVSAVLHPLQDHARRRKKIDA